MRSRTAVFAVIAIAILSLLVTAPQAVIGSFCFAAFVLVLWRMLMHRGGPLRRGGQR